MSNIKLTDRKGHEYELTEERILCNNVTLPDEFNPHNARLWIVGNEYGALCAVWADCDGDAIDEAIDSGLAAGLLIDEGDADEDTARGGNASEPYDGDNAWLAEIDLNGPRDWKLLCAFAQARGAGQTTLYL